MHTGFKIRLTPACGGFLSGSRGVIKTPRYPNNYATNLDCKWRVEVRPRRRIAFTFTSMDVNGPDMTCSQDFVMVS